MSAVEKFAGHWAESHSALHKWLCEKYQHTEIVTCGLSNTKTDIIGINSDGSETRYSCKYVSGQNTQIHLTTFNKFSTMFAADAGVHLMLQQWLGSHAENIFETWQKDFSVAWRSEELRKKRIYSDRFPEWHKLLEWFNSISLNSTLFQSLNGEPPVTRMLWINKKTGYFCVIDVNMLMEYMNTNCEWQNSHSARGQHTTLWYIDKLTGKRIMHLQMKGSGEKTGDYHGMMFHVFCNWPQGVIVHEEFNFWLG